MISMISEARARFLYDFGITEPATGDTSVIVTDLATTYSAEAHARDQLQFELGITDMNRYGADIIFRITRPADGPLIALANSGFGVFVYLVSKATNSERVRGGQEWVSYGCICLL